MSSAVFEEAELQALLEKIARDEGFKQPTYSIGSGSKPGQNFIGRVFRAVITEIQDGKEKSLSLIFKASSTNRERQDMMGGDVLFRNEKDMYEIVLPTLNNFLKKHGVADHPIFPGTPRCFATELNYATSIDKSDIIVLEDKKVQGFEVLALKTGLNADQCRIVLTKIALLHASSMALHELEPESADRLKKIFLEKNYNAKTFKDGLEDLRQGYISGLGLLGEPYKPGNRTYDTLHDVQYNFAELFMSRYIPPEDIFSITHTDLSSNNIMFKLNENGSTEDACLIDFQTAACSSVANDLAMLLLYCTTKKVRDEYFEGLLQFYFDEVTKILRDFGCDAEKIFPWALFQKHLKELMKYGVIYSLIGLPIMLADFSEIKVDIHSEESSSTFFSGTAEVANPESVKDLKQRLHDLIADGERLGYL